MNFKKIAEVAEQIVELADRTGLNRDELSHATGLAHSELSDRYIKELEERSNLANSQPTVR